MFSGYIPIRFSTIDTPVKPVKYWIIFNYSDFIVQENWKTGNQRSLVTLSYPLVLTEGYYWSKRVDT